MARPPKVARRTRVLETSLACVGVALASAGALREGVSATDRIPVAAPQPHAVPADTVPVAFWAALARLDLAQAQRLTDHKEHRRFLDALRLVMSGRMAEAEGELRTLGRDAPDSVMRAAARIMLSSALEYQGKWQALYELTADHVRSSIVTDQGRAGIDAWARIMRLAPPVRYRFPSDPFTHAFHLTATGVPVVPVRVNGHTKYFWLDTGTSLTLIASHVALECGVAPLAADTLEMVASVGRVRAQPTVLTRLEIGELLIEDQHAAIVQSDELALTDAQMRAGTSPIRIDGVIGFDVMRRLNVEIDFRSSRLTIMRPVARRTDERARNLLWVGYPVVRVSSPSGGTLHFGLDTGADSTFVTETILPKFGRRRLARQHRRITGFGGDTAMLLPIVPYLRVTSAERVLHLRNLTVRPPRRLIFVDLDGVLGSDVAVGRVMRIDMLNGVFSVTAEQ